VVRKEVRELKLNAFRREDLLDFGDGKKIKKCVLESGMLQKTH